MPRTSERADCADQGVERSIGGVQPNAADEYI
jgi:hypothetical protein